MLYFSRVTRHIEAGVHVMARSPHRYITPLPTPRQTGVLFSPRLSNLLPCLWDTSIKTLVNRAYTKTAKLTQTRSQKNEVIVCHVFILYAYCPRERKKYFQSKDSLFSFSSKHKRVRIYHLFARVVVLRISMKIMNGGSRFISILNSDISVTKNVSENHFP